MIKICCDRCKKNEHRGLEGEEYSDVWDSAVGHGWTETNLGTLCPKCDTDIKAAESLGDSQTTTSAMVSELTKKE